MSINRYISTPNAQFLQQIATNTQGVDVSQGSPSATQTQLQQVGTYGSNPSGAWKSLKVDANGVLETTSTTTPSATKNYVALETNTTKVAGSLSAVINIGESKTLQIVGNTSSSGVRIGISFESVNGYYTEGIFATTYYDGANYQFNLILREIPSQNIKILYQTGVNNLNLSYSHY